MYIFYRHSACFYAVQSFFSGVVDAKNHACSIFFPCAPGPKGLDAKGFWPREPYGEKHMQVSIKKFDVKMDVKNNGIEFEIYDNNGTFKGDCYLTKTGLIWCAGRTRKRNGKRISWAEFITMMES